MKMFLYGGPKTFLGFRLGFAFDLQEIRSWFRPLPTESSGTFVYVIRDALGRSKVGVSRDPRRRLRELQTGHPERLELAWCAVTPGAGFPIENMAKSLGEPRRMSGEWFQISPITMANMVHQSALALGEPIQQVPVEIIGTILDLAAEDIPTSEPFPFRSPWLFTFGASSIAAIVLSVLLVLRGY